MAERDILKETRERRVRLERATRESDSVITDLEDIGTRVGQGLEHEIETSAGQKLNKLKESRVYIEKLPKELGELTAGLEEELIKIGYTVEEARAFSAWERCLIFFGQKDLAEKRRLERLQNQSIRESLKQIGKLTVGTVNELGGIEIECNESIEAFGEDIKLEVNKLREAQPKYEEAIKIREAFEAQVKELKRELDAGISATERPVREEKLEELEKKFQKAHLYESELMIVIKIAQEAIPILQENREALQQLVKSIHGMRRQLLEKQEAFKSLLENAMTAVRSQAKIERFNAIDPVRNKVNALLTEINIKAAAGGMETLADRLAKASIDPDLSLRFTQELSQVTADFMVKLAAIAEEVEKGARRPSDSAGGGRGTSAGDGRSGANE